MSALHNADDEPEAGLSILFDFEGEDLSKERVQELIWNEIRDIHPEIPGQYPSSSRNGSNSGDVGKGEAKAESKSVQSDNDSKSALSRKRSISPSSAK